MVMAKKINKCNNNNDYMGNDVLLYPACIQISRLQCFTTVHRATGRTYRQQSSLSGTCPNLGINPQKMATETKMHENKNVCLCVEQNQLIILTKTVSKTV